MVLFGLYEFVKPYRSLRYINVSLYFRVKCDMDYFMIFR